MKKCNVGDHVLCPSGEMCSGNQCCKDGSTCPSAQNNFTRCPRRKTSDCTTEPSSDYFQCPSNQCCQVGIGQQCCAVYDPAGVCKQLGELCDTIYRTQPNRCGRTADGKIMCDCTRSISMTCCEKAGGVVNTDGLCTFDNMLKCTQALDCDIDPNPNSGIKPLNCTPGEDGIACKECQFASVSKIGTRCIIPDSGGIVGGCYITDWGDVNQKRKWQCLPANQNCKMTRIYDDCSFKGRCRKNRICTDGSPFLPSECSSGTCSSRVPGNKLLEKLCNPLEKTACDNNFITCSWTPDSDDKKDLCCKQNFGDQARWDSKNEACKFPCKNYCSFFGDDSGKVFWNCEG